MNWAVTAIGCALVVWCGLPWARGIAGSRPGRLPLLGLAYLTGTALLTLALLGVALVGGRENRLSLLVALLAVRFIGRRFVDRTPPPATPVAGPFWPAVPLLAAAAAALAYGTAQAFRLGPITSIDFLKAWGLKGTAMFTDGSLDFSRLTGPHLFYPLEVSNLNGGFYILLGRVDDTVVRLPAALFGIALAVVLWWMVREFLPPAGAALAVALAVMVPEVTTQMTNGLADLVVAAYVAICAVAAFRWLEDGGAGWASLSGFAAGAAAWTKLEGTLTCLVIGVTVLIIRRSLRTPGAGVWAAWFAVFIVPWQVFQRIHSIPANRSHFDQVYLSAGWIVRHVAETLAETAHWGVFWETSLAVIVLSAPIWWGTRFRLLAAVTLPNVALTLGAYVTHYRSGQADSVEATAHRLYLHLAPSLAVMAAAGATVAWQVLRAERDSPPVPVPEPVTEPV
jgi:hypothetical protein